MTAILDEKNSSLLTALPERVRESITITDPVTVHWVRSANDIQTDLWERCFPKTLEGRWWYQTLEASGLESQFVFAYGVIYYGEAPIGIMPIFSMDVPIDLVVPPYLVPLFRALEALFPQFGYQRTLFVGSPCADEGSVGLLPEFELAPLVHALQRELENYSRRLNTPMIVWKDFSAQTQAALDALPARDRMFKLPSYPGTAVSLPRGDFEDYLKSLKHSHRHNLIKKLRHSRQAVNLAVEVRQYPDPTMLSEIFALFSQTYERGKTKFERLTPDFFTNIAKLPTSHFVLLREPNEQKLVAFMLCFNLGSCIINKFIGFDYQRPKEWFLYFRLWEAAVNWAMSNGATQLQSGQTGYRPKMDIGHVLIPLHNYCKHRNPIINKIYSYVGRTISGSTLDEDLAVYFKAHPECAF